MRSPLKSLTTEKMFTSATDLRGHWKISSKNRGRNGNVKRQNLQIQSPVFTLGVRIDFPVEGRTLHVSTMLLHQSSMKRQSFGPAVLRKKAYDWEDFQNIKGCLTGRCTEVKDEEGPNGAKQKQFLGGCDLREAAGEAQKLKTIDDFNAAQASGSDAAPVLERLRSVFAEIGVENELFDQVVDGIKKKLGGDGDDEDDTKSEDILAATAEDLGNELKKAMKNIAVQQLRIK